MQMHLMLVAAALSLIFDVLEALRTTNNNWLSFKCLTYHSTINADVYVKKCLMHVNYCWGYLSIFYPIIDCWHLSLTMPLKH